MSSSKNILSYLKHVKSVINSKAYHKHIHFYLGNEASDADSIISSLTLAYLRHQTSDINTVHVPTACMKRSDLNLRRDVQILFEHIDLNISDIICVDDFDIFDSALFDSTLTLCDHNKLSIMYESLSNRVVEIVDHHIDAGLYNNVCGTSRMIAFDSDINKAEVASTCTLIVEKYIESGSEYLSREVAYLLMGVISLDTINMDVSAGLGTNRDARALDYLISNYFSIEMKNNLFVRLKNAKTDPFFWAQLSAFDCLRLDYKCFQVETPLNDTLHKSPVINIGTSAVLMAIADVIRKPLFTNTILSSMNDNDLQLYAILSFVIDVNVNETTDLNPSFDRCNKYRELMIFSKSQDVLTKLHEYLMRDNENRFNFQESQIDKNSFLPDLYVLSYNQLNLKYTRKQVAPELIEFAHSYHVENL
jgi:exopolyphosphatase